MKFPQMGDTYYYICSWGRIINMQYTNSVIDQTRILLGNLFQTEEQAEFALEKRKILVELEQIGIVPSFHFDNLEDATDDWWNAIEQIGEEKLNKYLVDMEICIEEKVGEKRFDKYILEVEKCDN